MLRTKIMILAVVLCALAVAPANAAFLVGKLTIQGDGVLVSNLGVDWLPANLVSATPPSTTTGTFEYQAPTATGGFAGAAVAGTLGTVRDLPSGLGSGALGVNSMNNFFLFNASYGFNLNNFDFILEYLDQGNIAPNNPIALVQVGTSVFASISGGGRIVDTNGDWVPFTAAFSTQFTSTTIANVINQAQQGGIRSSWSGEINSVPEPTTYAMLGAGLLALGLVRRKLS